MKEENNKPKKTIYYKDELNDDFAGTKIKTKPVDKNFKYIRKSFIWKFFSWVFYYLIAVPIVAFYCFVIRGVKIKNKKAVKRARKGRKEGIFFYCNHTYILDPFNVNMVSMPYRNQILASLDTFSIKGLKSIVQMLGAIPVPKDIATLRKLNNAIEYNIKHKKNIAIYPEAHIWPYYTGVRPFRDASFSYPVNLNSPVVAVFTAYSKPTGLFKKLRKTNMTLIVSDPIYSDPEKSKKEAKKELRDKVYEFMCDCSKKYSTYDYYVYKPVSDDLSAN